MHQCRLQISLRSRCKDTTKFVIYQIISEKKAKQTKSCQVFEHSETKKLFSNSIENNYIW